MFHWFQALLPNQGNFFALFEAHGETLLAGSNALVNCIVFGQEHTDRCRGWGGNCIVRTVSCALVLVLRRQQRLKGFQQHPLPHRPSENLCIASTCRELR